MGAAEHLHGRPATPRPGPPARRLERSELAAARRALRWPADAYLDNMLWAAQEGRPQGRFYAAFGPSGPTALAFFGDRRQLAAAGDPSGLAALAEVALGPERGWRLAVAVPELVAGVVARGAGRLRIALDRPQVLLAVTGRGTVPRDLLEEGPAPRPAVAADAERLTEACLELGREDLGVDPRAVDARRVRAHCLERVARGETLVVGPPGAFFAKLDVACTGLAGAMLEGIYTFPESRARGLARRIVAHAAFRLLASHRAVCLHVGRDNLPARRCYAAAGMAPAAELRLLLAAPA